MNAELYVYYKVAADHSERLQQSALAMQKRLKEEHGVQAALKRRPDAQGGLVTWMEIYRLAPHDFESILEQAVSAAELASLIDGPRHIERFLDVAPCA
jgi:hypothetical protein